MRNQKHEAEVLGNSAVLRGGPWVPKILNGGLSVMGLSSMTDLNRD